MFSEAMAKAKDLAPKAKAKAKDMTSCFEAPRGQGHGLEDSISGRIWSVHGGSIDDHFIANLLFSMPVKA